MQRLCGLPGTSIKKYPANVSNLSRCGIRRFHRVWALSSTRREVGVIAEDGSTLSTMLDVPVGKLLVQVQLKKPLGIILAEKDGKIIVDEIIAGGNASRADVRLGDILRATTARLQGVGPSLQGQQVLFVADNEDFSNTMTAIQSNTCAQCYLTIILEREGTATAED